MTDGDRNQADETHCDPDPHFGGCPVCGKTDGYMNVGPDHWFVCDAHKTKWNPAANLFSGWREENEEIWHQNAAKLADYRNVGENPEEGSLWNQSIEQLGRIGLARADDEDSA